MKRVLFAAAVFTIILIALGNSKESYLSSDNNNSGVVINEDKTISINIKYDEDTPTDTIDNVKNGIIKMPVDVMTTFVDNGWQIDLTKDDVEEGSEIDDGLKTIYLKNSNITYIDLIMARYAERYVYQASGTEAFAKIHNQYKTTYSDKSDDEFFACCLRDYCLFPEDLRTNSPDMYRYFTALIKEDK